MRQPLDSQKRPAPVSGHLNAPESPLAAHPWSPAADLVDLLPDVDLSALDELLGPIADLDALLGPAVDLASLLGEGEDQILRRLDP